MRYFVQRRKTGRAAALEFAYSLDCMYKRVHLIHMANADQGSCEAPTMNTGSLYLF